MDGGDEVQRERRVLSPRELADAIRRSVIVHSKRANVGHIGSSLSIADILAVLYGSVARLEGPARDRIILSKGHAALALYAALEQVGILDSAALDTFCSADGLLATHPERGVDGIEFSTGSLGHGLSYGAGAALAAAMRDEDRRTFVVLSDAELNEGSVWEAAMFAAHHRLARLVAIVDVNGQQAFGYTRDVLDLSPLAPRWEANGWEVREAPGHDLSALESAIGDTSRTNRPVVVLAATTFGSGVSFMEGVIRWHYQPLADEDYERALEELTSNAG